MEEVTLNGMGLKAGANASQSKFTGRLHDTIMVFLLLIAFPIGFALLALSCVFGRSLPRAASALVFLGILHVSAIVNILLGGTVLAGMLEESPGLLLLMTQGSAFCCTALESNMNRCVLRH